MKPLSLFDKVWLKHIVMKETAENPAVLYIDLHLVHEVTSPQAFHMLRDRDLGVRRPDKTFATIDHSIPTLPFTSAKKRAYVTPQARAQVEELERNCEEFGIRYFGWESKSRGIVHVIGPELGLTQPGQTIVCGDSHTSTHGAFGAMAFGIGTTQVSHVLATQCLLQRKPKQMAITVKGKLKPGVSAKDLILAIIAKIGIHAGTGHVIEYRGEGIRALTMEQRMTVCNMSIEAGARAGMIAPDDTTLSWLKDRPYMPKGRDFVNAARRWLTLASDPGAVFDQEIEIDASSIAPMITYGTNPAMAMAIDEPVPMNDDPDFREACDYMKVEPGKPMLGMPVDTVFIGSCTNARLPDLQEAAALLKGHTIHPGLRMLVVPGSAEVKLEAERLGLDNIFITAGAEWREPGCSMCIAMNGDQLSPGQIAVSTSNRNFKGRQGAQSRTVLASPLTAAATAIAGKISDPRPFMEKQNVK